MEAKAESSKHVGCDRTDSNGETVGMGQLRWEEECGNMMSLFVTLGLTSFGNSWREEQGAIAVGKEVSALGRESFLLLFLLSSLPAFPGGLREEQLEIKPPHLTVFHHLHHFAWVKSQAVPSKILNVIDPSSSNSSYWSSPICFGK